MCIHFILLLITWQEPKLRAQKSWFTLWDKHSCTLPLSACVPSQHDGLQWAWLLSLTFTTTQKNKVKRKENVGSRHQRTNFTNNTNPTVWKFHLFPISFQHNFFFFYLKSCVVKCIFASLLPIFSKDEQLCLLGMYLISLCLYEAGSHLQFYDTSMKNWFLKFSYYVLVLMLTLARFTNKILCL